MFEPNIGSRFQPRENVPVLPGCCYLCRGTTGPFIDTRADVPWEGAVYICKGCIVEMHRQLGLDVPVNEEEIVTREAAAFESGHQLGIAQVRTAFDDFVSGYIQHLDAVSDPAVPTTIEDSAGRPEGSGKSKSGRRKPDSGSVEVNSLDSGAGHSELSADSTDGESSISDLIVI